MLSVCHIVSGEDWTEQYAICTVAIEFTGGSETFGEVWLAPGPLQAALCKLLTYRVLRQTQPLPSVGREMSSSSPIVGYGVKA